MNKFSCFKKFMGVIIWPILFGVGQFFVVLLLSFIYAGLEISKLMSSQNISFAQSLQKINMDGISNFLNNYAILFVLLEAILLLPILVREYKKYKEKNEQTLSFEIIMYSILLAVCFSITMNSLTATKASLTLFIFLNTGILGPILEEYLFRGIVYNKLKQFLSLKKSMIISILIFAFAHTTISQIILGLFLGIITVQAYEKTKSLKIPILIHIIVNSTALLSTLFIYKLSLQVRFILFVICIIGSFIFYNILIKKLDNHTMYR